MKPFAIELDDRAVSTARAGQVLSSVPSAVHDGSSGAPAGANAWSALRSQPTATSTRHLSFVLNQRDVVNRSRGAANRYAALVAEELKKCLIARPADAAERVWIASPARVEVFGLGALLAIARGLALPVDGFVDSAAVTVAALGLEINAVVLELGLHHAAATAIDCEAGQARRRRTVLASGGGFLELHEAWLDLIGTTMVKRSRFDPLHDAATEQQLFDALPTLAREAAASGNTTAVVTKGTERFEVALSRDQFGRAGQSIYGALAGLVHQLRPAGTPIAIVIPRSVAELPGLREELEQFVDCHLVLVPDGFAAAATSLLDLPESPPEQDSVRLLRRLPLQVQMPMADAVSREMLGRRRSGGPAPSHVLLDGRAYPLSVESLVIGRAPGVPNAFGTPVAQRAPTDSGSGADAVVGTAAPVAAGSGASARAASAAAAGLSANSATPRSITLPDGLAGVSRRHCTFVHDSGELVLLDHSTFGTFVNGERVAERVRVHAGDRVRLGMPGVELALIAVGEVAAATSQP